MDKIRYIFAEMCGLAYYLSIFKGIYLFSRREKSQNSSIIERMLM